MQRTICLLVRACALSLSLSLATAHAADRGVPALPEMYQDFVAYAVTDLPEHFKSGPVAATDNTPVDNPITNPGATLGRVLFYDPRLSHNDGTSCASCHQQATGFGDENQFSEGFEGGLTGRHSTALSNAAYYANGRMFWDERAASVEEQVLMPIQDPVEMGTDLDQLRDELAATDYYPKLFQQAFGDSQITNDRISKALGQFVRSMVSYQSKYDQAVEAGTPEAPDYASIFTPLEQQGAELFHGAGQCSQCHTTHAQVGDRARNIGLDADNTADEGAGNGTFKTQSLRNVAVRGRFMHDGRHTTLEEVVEFYSTGIQDNPYLDNRLKTNGEPTVFNFSDQEIDALVAFMETLTDEAFLTSDLFSNPFVSLPGDYDGSGVVDQDDYLLWRDQFGATGDNWADGNADGMVDAADYTLWRDNLGASWEDFTPGSASSGAVPEPVAIAVLLPWVATWLTLRSRSPAPNC
ncbi:Cytochrome c551 peroxidase precursor [Posidoniimonas corsicana]|uniref:Cytochrome c551 peroxidase n=1 Tax=Posidoniimonas corsicana TaxID=1938618 RepID=A0A5C5UXJ7_9BACT|nr:cytochrome c peroxidase [Posidoniimonas corsicana]TWT30192.1 Cytochrome c551 peroxidase precursor [Posidoniimonas corsicana]